MSKKEKPKVKVIPTPKGKQPKTPQPQQKLTEEQAFMQYINQLISNAVLDNETIKTKSVETIKSLGQQLGLYMREVTRLKADNEKLSKGKKPIEPKK